MRNMNHLATVIDTACPTGSTTTLEPDGRIKPLEHDYARRSDRTIGRAALAVSADRALPGRLAHLDGLAQTMRGTPRAHRRALLRQYRHAAERIGRAVACAGHCPYDEAERLRRWGTTDPIAIAGVAVT